MSGSVFGTLFRVATFGESHGRGVGAVVEGVPAGLALTEADLQPQLSRRRPGQSALSTPRDEEDRVLLLSGTEGGIALGSPVGLLVHNKDQRPGDYGEMAAIPRPSHADYSYQMKYGVRASSGGGRSSARETIARVAAGAIAEKALLERHGVSIVAWVSAAGGIACADLSASPPTRGQVDATPMRCPDPAAARRMMDAVAAARAAGDSLGGVITCVASGLPAGWGEPAFDKCEALLAHAMLSIPATKGFEIGSGFAGADMRGSEHNDPFERGPGGTLRTTTNYSGGIQGGITNGMPVVFRVAFKPPATISRAQATAAFSGEPSVLEARGRHDPCVVNRAVPIVETMAALVLFDLALRQDAQRRS